MEEWRVALILTAPFLFFALGWGVRALLSTLGIRSVRPAARKEIGTVSATTSSVCGAAALSMALLAPHATPLTLLAGGAACVGVGGARVGSRRHSLDQVLAGAALGLVGTLVCICLLRIVGLNL